MKLSFIIHITLVLLTATYEEGVSFAFPISYDEQSNSFQTSLSIQEIPLKSQIKFTQKFLFITKRQRSSHKIRMGSSVLVLIAITITIY